VTSGINHLIPQSSGISSPLFQSIQQKDSKRERSEVQGAATGKTPTWILFTTSLFLHSGKKAAYVTQKALGSRIALQKDLYGKTMTNQNARRERNGLWFC